MPIPRGVTRFNKRIANPVLGRLVGVGPFAELEHVGRRSGRVRHTVLLAFRRGSGVVVALTYGPDVDWFKNIGVAGAARMRLGGLVLDLGPAARLSAEDGLDSMPAVVRPLLRLAGVRDFIELPVLAEHSAH